jgi:mRNA interferase RelE/StbE
MSLSYKIKFSTAGYKQLKKLPQTTARRVIKKINILKSFSNKTSNVKKIRGTQNSVYRLRISNLRVLFEVEKKDRVIWIIAIGYRGNIYKQ